MSQVLRDASLAAVFQFRRRIVAAIVTPGSGGLPGIPAVMRAFTIDFSRPRVGKSGNFQDRFTEPGSLNPVQKKLRMCNFGCTNQSIAAKEE
jgi:hypothetical protein